MSEDNVNKLVLEHGDVNLEDRAGEKMKSGVWECAPMDGEIGDGLILFDHLYMLSQPA